MSGATSRAERLVDEMEVLRQFRDALSARDIVVAGEIIADGKIHRADVAGRGGKGDASYLLHVDGLAAGGYTNWKDGLGWQDWSWRAGRVWEWRWTEAERDEIRRKRAADRVEREADEARRQAEAAAKAAEIWFTVEPCDAHPYLTKKGVQAHGVRVSRGDLVLPLRDAAGALHSLQFIKPEGGKKYLAGGRVSGCYHSIGKPGDIILVGEGYATCATVHEATGHAAAVAFDAGNLKPVAEALRVKYPMAQIVVVADDDHLTVGNPGLTKAKEAAAAVNGVVVAPDFGADRPAKATDFNDLMLLAGANAVRKCIEAALTAPAAAPQPRLRPLSVAQFLTLEIPGREMMLGPWLPEKGLAMIHSPRGVGKTHFATTAGYAVASAGAFLGFQAPRPRRVVYLDGEMPANAMQLRLAALVAGFKTEPPDPSFFRILSADLIEGGLPDLATDEGQAEIDAAIGDAELIIVDNISTLVRSGKENEAEGWLPVQGWALAHRRAGRSILFIHHAGKGGLQRGTSRREDVLDSVVALRRPKDYRSEEGARFELVFEKARGFFGADAREFEAKYEERNGAAVWSRTEIADVELMQVVDVIRDGMSIREAADELGIHRSKVERLRKKAIEGGLLDG